MGKSTSKLSLWISRLRLAPVGCPDSGSAEFFLYFFWHPTLSLELWKYQFCNICYGRLFLHLARYWWKDLARNIKPVMPTQWNELKANGILTSSRGKRNGAHSKLRENHGESNATFVPTYFKSKADVETAKKHTQRELMVSVLNMQTDTSVSLPTNEPDSVTTICSFAFKHHVTGPRAQRNWCYHKYYLCRYLSLHWNMAEWICSRWIFEFKWFPTFRRDRVGWEHGGVCIYVRNSMQCNILSDLGNDDHEVLWIDITSKFLQHCGRGLSSPLHQWQHYEGVSPVFFGKFRIKVSQLCYYFSR